MKAARDQYSSNQLKYHVWGHAKFYRRKIVLLMADNYSELV